MNEQTLYSDIIEKGGLIPAVQSALSDIHSPLTVKGLNPHPHGFPAYARVEANNRFSQIYVAAERPRFSCDYWKEGVLLGSGITDSLIDLARSLNTWIHSQVNTGELTHRFPFVSIEDNAEFFEQGQEVEWKWQECQRYIPQQFPELVPFLNQASQNTILRQLFPFTSLNRFCFSRCTGFPYSYDCPIVSPLRNGLYEVLDSKEKRIGEGSVAEAVEMVISHLPLNCGAAQKGTAKDLDEAVFQ